MCCIITKKLPKILLRIKLCYNAVITTYPRFWVHIEELLSFAQQFLSQAHEFSGLGILWLKSEQKAQFSRRQIDLPVETRRSAWLVPSSWSDSYLQIKHLSSSKTWTPRAMIVPVLLSHSTTFNNRVEPTGRGLLKPQSQSGHPPQRCERQICHVLWHTRCPPPLLPPKLD